MTRVLKEQPPVLMNNIIEEAWPPQREECRLRGPQLHRDTWVEIYLDKIEDNILQLKDFLPPSTAFMAAVKADAYGHGALEVAQISLKAGADGLVVSILEEALYLRNNGITAPILVLTPIKPHDVDLAIANDLSVTLIQAAWIKEMKTYRRQKDPLKVHLKIDTGLGRIGLRSISELKEITALIRDEGILIEGMYTHFATANHNDPSFYKSQYRQFVKMMNWTKAKKIPIKAFHCSNTAATLKYPEDILDMVRIGVGMFGIYPSRKIQEEAPVHLSTALSFHSRILQVKKVLKGSKVGYDQAYTATEDQWIATIPVGYGDGWFRCFQGFHLLVEGEVAPIVGRICMDQIMIKLPRSYPAGTQVTLIGENNGLKITLEDLANHIGSVPQEIPSMITYRVPRIYYYKGAPVQIQRERTWGKERSLLQW